MSEIKKFEFAAKRAEGESISGSFELNGETFAVRYLPNTNVAYLVAAINDTSDPMRVVTKVIDFMHRALTKDDGPRFEKLVLDPDNGLEIDELLQVFQHVLTLAAAERPTGSSSDSSEPSSKTGTASRSRRSAAASTR
jgi:hypothetical protein